MKILYPIAIFLGITAATLFLKFSHYCLAVDTPHMAFYGPFSRLLQEDLTSLGYMQCPSFLPKTVIHFSPTADTADKKDTHFIFLQNDAQGAVNVDWLRNFDFIITPDEYYNGYLSTYNLRTVYLPLPLNLESDEAFTPENRAKIKEISTAIDTLIQRAAHEE
jgi:hypothetical protein